MIVYNRLSLFRVTVRDIREDTGLYGAPASRRNRVKRLFDRRARRIITMCFSNFQTRRPCLSSAFVEKRRGNVTAIIDIKNIITSPQDSCCERLKKRFYGPNICRRIHDENDVLLQRHITSRCEFYFQKIPVHKVTAVSRRHNKVLEGFTLVHDGGHPIN